MKTSKFIEDTVVAQVPAERLNKDLVAALKKRADFLDADEELGECMVSVGTLPDVAVKKTLSKQSKKQCMDLYKEMLEMDFNYVQILFI